MSLWLILAAVAAAQDITVSGELGMTWASRDRVINEASVWTPGGSALRESDTLVLPRISVRFDVDLRPVRAVIEIGNRLPGRNFPRLIMIIALGAPTHHGLAANA